MTDKPLFDLDAKARWRLAYDSQQWVVQRRSRKGRVRHFKGRAVADSGWQGRNYVGLDKCVLYRCIRERGVVLTPEAVARLDALPERFADFIAEPEWLFARPEAA